MKRALLYVLVFVGIQFLASGVVQGIYTLLEGSGPVDATRLIIISALADVITLVLFLLLRWAEVSRHWVRTRPWTVLFWCCLAAFGAIIPSTYIQELLPELPSNADDEFDMLMGSRMGYFVIALGAPASMEEQSLGGYHHLFSAVCCLPHESCANAACLPRWFIVGLDVLPHGQHCAWCGVSLGEQHGGLRTLSVLSQCGYRIDRPVQRQPEFRLDGCGFLVVYLRASIVSAEPTDE